MKPPLALFVLLAYVFVTGVLSLRGPTRDGFRIRDRTGAPTPVYASVAGHYPPPPDPATGMDYEEATPVYVDTSSPAYPDPPTAWLPPVPYGPTPRVNYYRVA